MSVKLKISDPVIIAQGPRYKDVGWGEFQFPLVGACAEDGSVYASVQITEDSGDAYGSRLGHAFFVSKDEGEHWEALPKEEWEAASMRQALRLPSGEHIRLPSTPIVRVAPEALPAPASVLYGPESGRDRVLYRASDIPDSLVHKGWYVDRYDPKTGEISREQAKLDWPNMCIGGGRDYLVSPWPIGRMRLSPDGTLFHTHYWRGLYPENGAPDLFFQQYYFKSEDAAHSWSLVCAIPFVPDVRKMPRAYFADGFCEADIAFMPDGSIFTLLRTGYSLDMQFPMYYARSTDGGRSFSEPQIFDRLGVWPTLCSLSCGVTLASYGRPGFFIRATDARDGLVWDDPIELLSAEVKPDAREIPPCPGESRAPFEWRSGCGYSDMIPLDARTALLVYTDFYVPDENGENRKTLLCRKITVEE